jgi:cysteinyl-tRNA synthetase
MNRTGAGTALALAVALVAAGCTAGRPPRPAGSFDSWVYQLQGYPDGTLDALARAPQRLAVIDLARDAGTDWFRADEIAALRASGKRVLAYVEIGSLERFRPEYATVRDRAADLIGNQWTDWPDEYFVRYWDPRWWDLVVRPRIDRRWRPGSTACTSTPRWPTRRSTRRWPPGPIGTPWPWRWSA